MSMKSILVGIGIWVAVISVLVLLMIVIVGAGTFYIPSMVPQFKAQGLTELPFGLQLIVDIADFTIHRFYIAFPILIGASLLIAKLIASRVGGDRGA